jgi:FkbM family methyltransferase
MSKALRFVKDIVRPVVHFIKDLVSPVVNGIEKRQLKGKLLADLSNAKSGYAGDLTEEDVDLYISERFVRLPTCVTEKTSDPELVTVTINERKIFWPAILPDIDLPWLFHEVFDDFTTNPSSYNYPKLDYGNRKWVIDAGAAEGYFSIFALEKSLGALIISVEPLPLMNTALLRTFASHESGKKAVVVSAALGDKPGWSDIQIDYEHICDSKLLSHTEEAAPPVSNSVTQRVPVTTLDQLAIQHSLGIGGLIKMDIEGYEMAALSGALNVLKEHKPALAIAVYHDLENARKCADIIKAANSSYKIEFRGCYGYFDPPRPYMLFAT